MDEDILLYISSIICILLTIYQMFNPQSVLRSEEEKGGR